MATVFGAGATSRSGRSGRGARASAARSPALGRTPREPARPSSPPSLNTLISEEIIPRLLQAHPLDQVPAANGLVGIDPEDAARFASLPLRLEADELLAEIEVFLGRGVSVETVLVDLLATSARRLGQHWDNDECDFLDVTMGLWRIQECMREITLRNPSSMVLPARPRTALFTPVPGDDHSLGALMVEEVFARAGWDTEVLTAPKRGKLLQIVGERHFDLVGLTITSDCHIGTLSDLISAMRIISRSPELQVLIGGRTVNENPEIVNLVGADGSAADARSALSVADRIVGHRAQLDRSGV